MHIFLPSIVLIGKLNALAKTPCSTSDLDDISKTFLPTSTLLNSLWRDFMDFCFSETEKPLNHKVSP